MENDIRAACLVMCRSGKFETGQGTCAPICMQFLGSPRTSLGGCGCAEQVHGELVSAIKDALSLKEDSHA